MRAGVVFSALVMACSLAGRAEGQGLTIDIADGFVTLDARDVSVQQILARWAQVAGVTVVNADKISTSPVTLQLNRVPERAALQTLLRGVGYVLGSQDGPGSQNRINRIAIFPFNTTSTAMAPVRAAAPESRGQTSTDQYVAATLQRLVNEVPASTSGEPADPVNAATLANPLTVVAPGATPFRPASNPIQYTEQYDADGNRVRADTVDRTAEILAAAAKGQTQVPPNPFGVTSGASQPGVNPPAQTQPAR
jgi:hypothetical protein